MLDTEFRRLRAWESIEIRLECSAGDGPTSLEFVGSADELLEAGCIERGTLRKKRDSNGVALRWTKVPDGRIKVSKIGAHSLVFAPCKNDPGHAHTYWGQFLLSHNSPEPLPFPKEAHRAHRPKLRLVVNNDVAEVLPNG